MKQFLFLTVILSLSISFACSGKPANTDVNANAAAAENPFAAITDANAALAEGNRLMDENDTLMAIEAYRRALELNGDLAEAHFKLGIAYALVEMQMEQEGKAADTVDSKGRTRSEKEFEKAVADYKKWLDANPDDDVAHYNLGRTYNKLYKDEEAEKQFRAAVKLKPDDTEYQTEHGASLIRLARYREAIGPLKKAIELDEGNERAISLLEDAEAGRQRLDYQPKNSNANTSSKANANSNTSANSATNSNTATKPGNSNSRPAAPKASPTPNRPNRPK